MYLLWRYKDMNPSEYKNLGDGEKIIISGFMEHYLEDEGRKYEEVQESITG